MVKLAGGKPVIVEGSEKNDMKISAGQLRDAITPKTKLVILNSPSNPTGMVYSGEELRSLAEVIVESGIYVLSDEIYEKLLYEGVKHVSIASFSEEIFNRTITVNGVSKAYCMTGWRIGMLVGNASMVDALKRVKSNMDSGIPQAIQYAAIEALTGPQDCIQEHNAIYQRRRDLVVEALNSIGLEAKLPKASLYVWAKIPEGYTSAEFTADLLEQVGVVVTPGTGYGPHGEGYVRLSLTIPDAGLVKGLSRLAGWRDSKNNFRKKRKLT
ncbi:Aspartate aminotransferase [subsurface metagenome]